MKWNLICLLAFLPGCLASAPVPRNGPPPTPDPIQIHSANPTPNPSPPAGLDSVSVEVGADVVATLHAWLGDENQITIKNPLTIKQPGGQSIAIPAGASFTWNLSDVAGLFSFLPPKPIITTYAGPFQIHPTLDRIKLFPPNKGQAEVTELGTTHKKLFVLDWVEEKEEPVKAKAVEPEVELIPQPEAPRPPAIDTPPPIQKKPELIMYTASWCGKCGTAKAAFIEYTKKNELPFDLVFVDVDKQKKPDWVRNMPTFYWGDGENVKSSKNHFSQEGWASVKQLVDAFNTSRNPKSHRKIAALSISSEFVAHVARTWPESWIETEYGYTRPEHLENTHGIPHGALHPFTNDRAALDRIHGWCHRIEVSQGSQKGPNNAISIPNFTGGLVFSGS